MILSTSLLTLLVTASLPSQVTEAASRALAVKGGRVEVVNYQPAMPPGCQLTSVELPPLTHSGRYAARLSGEQETSKACQGQAWIQVRVWATALVTQRAIRPGETLEGAVTPQEHEQLAFRELLSALPPGAIAARAIAGGAVLEPSHLRVGPETGGSLTVVVNSGSVRLEQVGRRVACGGQKVCAILPTGKRVEGRLENDELLVEAL
jgi:hypothetical protein